MFYQVIQRIQSVRIDRNEPVDVQFYGGDDRAEAITAMAQASNVSDPEWVRLLSVTLVVTEQCGEFIYGRPETRCTQNGGHDSAHDWDLDHTCNGLVPTWAVDCPACQYEARCAPFCEDCDGVTEHDGGCEHA